MTTTFADSDADMNDLKDADCRNCCDTGMVVDSNSGEASACPACRTIDSSADPRAAYLRRSLADGLGNEIRPHRFAAPSSVVGAVTQATLAGVVTVDDLRVAIGEARRVSSRDVLDIGAERVPLSYLLALADLAVEYLESERKFGESSCAVMRGSSSKEAELEACARRVAVAEVALRSVTGTALPLSSTTCQDLSISDDLAIDGAVPKDVKPRGDSGRWWSRIWNRSRSTSMPSP